ncbi:hypothetical protein AB0J65_24410, partial [Streptomyces toxytricini]
MDEREILTRFRDGTLDRGQAMALLAGVVPAAVPVAAGALAAPAAAAAPAVPAAGPSGPARATAAPTPAAPAAPSGGEAGAVVPVAVVGMALRQPQAPDTAA